MNSTSFVHSGIKDMRWGIRRFQNKDGTWTPLGLARRRDPNKLDLSTASNEDLKKATERLRAETNYLNAYNERHKNRHKVGKFVGDLAMTSVKQITQKAIDRAFEIDKQNREIDAENLKNQQKAEAERAKAKAKSRQAFRDSVFEKEKETKKPEKKNTVEKPTSSVYENDPEHGLFVDNSKHYVRTDLGNFGEMQTWKEVVDAEPTKKGKNKAKQHENTSYADALRALYNGNDFSEKTLKRMR